MTEQRLIDANELLDEIDKLNTWVVNDYGYCLEDRIVIERKQVEWLIEEAPTVERPRREWWRHRESRTGGCSECKFITDIFNTGLWNFCPNCGADMRGEGE